MQRGYKPKASDMAIDIRIQLFVFWTASRQTLAVKVSFWKSIWEAALNMLWPTFIKTYILRVEFFVNSAVPYTKGRPDTYGAAPQELQIDPSKFRFKGFHSLEHGPTQ